MKERLPFWQRLLVTLSVMLLVSYLAGLLCQTLLGVPILIKECHEVAGLPFTNGLLSRRHVLGQQDCTAVKRIREGGMIVLGNTNTSECCMWMECCESISFSPSLCLNQMIISVYHRSRCR